MGKYDGETEERIRESCKKHKNYKKCCVIEIGDIVPRCSEIESKSGYKCVSICVYKAEKWKICGIYWRSMRGEGTDGGKDRKKPTTKRRMRQKYYQMYWNGLAFSVHTREDEWR